MKASPCETEIDLEMLFEIIDIVHQCIKEREEFLQPTAIDLMKIAKTGNMRKLRAEILRSLDNHAWNVWLGFILNIEERYGVDL